MAPPRDSIRVGRLVIVKYRGSGDVHIRPVRGWNTAPYEDVLFILDHRQTSIRIMRLEDGWTGWLSYDAWDETFQGWSLVQ